MSTLRLSTVVLALLAFAGVNIAVVLPGFHDSKAMLEAHRAAREQPPEVAAALMAKGKAARRRECVQIIILGASLTAISGGILIFRVRCAGDISKALWKSSPEPPVIE